MPLLRLVRDRRGTGGSCSDRCGRTAARSAGSAAHRAASRLVPGKCGPESAARGEAWRGGWAPRTSGSRAQWLGGAPTPKSSNSACLFLWPQRGGEERVFEKEEEEDDEEEEEEEEDNVSEGSEVPESDRPAGAQHHQINGERGPQSAKERVKEWSPCGPYQGQDEGRGPAPGSCTRQVFSMTATNKEGGSACVAAAPDSPSPVPLPPGKPALPGADGTPFGCPPGRKEKPSDPVEWTVMDVVEYFTEAGFPEQATAFQEQEIDGKSLLLMQRTDVLTGLSIRLGPALKIYEHHIKVLQQGHFEDDDPDGFLG
ncbi:atherin isoform X1 [Cricetulus griseus]|uniref:atherin isoform X1 n=1 Tax=Cricetulus griseus TaxID=10029 RepID=UPI0004543252|nr:atherin isoform X1 [Cricetulus griseus]